MKCQVVQCRTMMLNLEGLNPVETCRLMVQGVSIDSGFFLLVVLIQRRSSFSSDIAFLAIRSFLELKGASSFSR